MRKYISFLTLYFLVTASCLAQTGKVGYTTYTGFDEEQFKAWAAEEWTSDDKPYQIIRKNVEKAVKGKRDLAVIAEKYEEQYRKNQSDPKALFRWTYAVDRASQLSAAYTKKRKRAKVKWAMRRMHQTQPPHSYEFTRLHFLVEAQDFPTGKLASVGERLLRRNSKDYPVKYFLINVLTPIHGAGEKRKMLRYAQELVDTFPKSYSAYSSLGSVYYRSWLISNDKSDAAKAIMAYRKSLELAPAKHPYRVQVQALIKMMQK